jgi:outer membrane protein assembly factor BamB
MPRDANPSSGQIAMKSQLIPATVVCVLCGVLAWLSTRPKSTVGPPRAEGTIALGLSQTRQKKDFHDWPALLGPRGNCSTSGDRLNLDWSGSGPTVAWRVPIGAGYSAPVARGESVIVFHRLGSEERIDCYDAETGERCWSVAYPTQYNCRFEYSNGPYSTPVIDKDNVYAWGAEGVLHCLRLAGGELVWRRTLNDDYAAPARDFPVAASPLVEGDLLILNVGGTRGESGIVALDRSTGETRWQSTSEPAAYATPVAATIHARRMVFVFGYDHLIALNPITGDIYWQIEFHAKNRDLGKFNATSPLVVDDCVIVSAYSIGTLCVQIRADGTHREKWRASARQLDSQYAPLIASGRRIFGFATRNRSLMCLDASNGESLWQWPSEIGREAQMLLVGKQLLLFGETGQLMVLDVASLPPKFTKAPSDCVLDPPCFTTPTISGGRMFVRNEKELVCFDLRVNR